MRRFGHNERRTIQHDRRAIGVAVALGLLFVAILTPSKAQQTAPTEIFGEEVMLTAKPVVLINGKATWDSAFPTLAGSFKSLGSVLAANKLQAAGPAMTIYTLVNTDGFEYQAAIPIAQAPASLPRGFATLGQSPAGKAMKFVHRGSYDSMDMLYETIIHFLDEKRIERQGLFIEEYLTDPTTTPEDQLVVNVFVLVK